MRVPRPPRGGSWKGPQLPRHLLRTFHKVETHRELQQDEGGTFKTTTRYTSPFLAALLPLSNEDLERLPEGTATVNSQKLYTNGETLGVGQKVQDALDNQVYTVTNELTHAPIHGLKRYVVTGKGAVASG